MSLQLELEGVEGTLEGFKSGTEKIGPDEVPCAELKVSVARPTPDELANFSPTLKGWLFNDAAPRDLAGGLQLRDTHMVYPLERDEEMLNAEVVIDYGVTQKIRLTDSHIDQIKITPREGGAVVYSFRISCKPDAFKDVPHLYLLQKKIITLHLKPAKLPEMKDAA